jgi:hypothetical protein
MTGPEASAPVVPTPRRNRLGTVALVLALVDFGLPLVVFIVITIAAMFEGAEGDSFGYAVLGGLFFAFGSIPFFSPLAIAAVALGIVAVARRGYAKVAGILAIVVAIIPAVSVIYLPAVIDSFF